MKRKHVEYSYTEVRTTQMRDEWDTVPALTNKDAIEKVKKRLAKEKDVKVKNFKVKSVTNYVEKDYSDSPGAYEDGCSNHCGG